MSYARFSYADVYVFATNTSDHQVALECCGCLLGDDWMFYSTQDMVDHLAKHREAGHMVPDGIEADLWADDDDNFNPERWHRCDLPGCERLVSCGTPMLDGTYVSTCSMDHQRMLGTSILDAKEGIVKTDADYPTEEAVQARLAELDAERKAWLEELLRKANTASHGND
jgi:hypothetical protein